MTQEELEAAALRSVFCTYAFNGDVRWLRSYFDAERDELLCVYEARDTAQITQHADLAAIPCDEIREVAELLSDRFYEEAETQGGAAAPGAPHLHG